MGEKGGVQVHEVLGTSNAFDGSTVIRVDPLACFDKRGPKARLLDSQLEVRLQQFLCEACGAVCEGAKARAQAEGAADEDEVQVALSRHWQDWFKSEGFDPVQSLAERTGNEEKLGCRIALQRKLEGAVVLVCPVGSQDAGFGPEPQFGNKRPEVVGNNAAGGEPGAPEQLAELRVVRWTQVLAGNVNYECGEVRRIVAGNCNNWCAGTGGPPAGFEEGLERTAVGRPNTERHKLRVRVKQEGINSEGCWRCAFEPESGLPLRVAEEAQDGVDVVGRAWLAFPDGGTCFRKPRGGGEVVLEGEGPIDIDLVGAQPDGASREEHAKHHNDDGCDCN